MCTSPLLKAQIYILAVFTMLCFMNLTASAEVNFPNPKAKAVYESINRKIEALNREREKKKDAVKARHYDSYKEKEYLDKLDAKYDAVIERYKDKCNTYFKRAGAKPPWHTKKVEEEKRAALEKLHKAKEAAEKKRQEEYRKKLEQQNSSSVPISASSPSETDDSFIKPPPPPQLPDHSNVYTPTPSQENLPQTETPSIAQTTVNTASQKNSTSSGIAPIVAGITTLIALILAVISVIILIVAWKKMPVFLKSTCGCSTIFFGILTLASGSFLVYSIMFSEKPPSTHQAQPTTISSVTNENGVQVVNKQPPAIIPHPSATSTQKITHASTYPKAIKLPDDIQITTEESKYPGANTLVIQAKEAIESNDMNALKEVLKQAKQKVEENPDSVDDLMNLGLILFMMDNNEEVNLLADKAFSQVLKLQPDNIEAQRMLADVRYRSELFDSAIVLLEPLIESGDWMDKKTVALITLCYARDEQYEAGLDFLNRMADKNPNRPDIRIDYAILARQAGEYSLAKQALNRVLSKPDLNPETRKWAEGVMAMCNAGGKSK